MEWDQGIEMKSDSLRAITHEIRAFNVAHRVRHDVPKSELARLNERQQQRIARLPEIYPIIKDLTVKFEKIVLENGRPRLQPRDILFSLILKEYIGCSTRDSMPFLIEAAKSGFLSQIPSYNSLSRALGDPFYKEDFYSIQFSSCPGLYGADDLSVATVRVKFSSKPETAMIVGSPNSPFLTGSTNGGSETVEQLFDGQLPPDAAQETYRLLERDFGSRLRAKSRLAAEHEFTLRLVAHNIHQILVNGIDWSGKLIGF